MRFNGKSGVEVRLPRDLDDLKGYTSLSLFLQRPESGENGATENMFVMYLGNKDVSAVGVSPALKGMWALGCVTPLGCAISTAEGNPASVPAGSTTWTVRGAFISHGLLPAAELRAFHMCTVSTCIPGQRSAPLPCAQDSNIWASWNHHV